MTTISAQVIADSESKEGVRLTTLQLRYPRWIHAEARTHRVFSLDEELPTPSLMQDRNLSRNASSSRAVPVERLIQDVIDDPAVPLFWGANQKGMQAGEEINTPILIDPAWMVPYQPRAESWLLARDQAARFAKAFSDAGYHKQIVNRLLEPFSHINVVVTATEWDNFFRLRLHPDAEPHIRLLAERMEAAIEESCPKRLGFDDWHLPYIGPSDLEAASKYDSFLTVEEIVVRVSVARCARVSYKTHDGRQSTIAEDLALYERLYESQHLSPFEHVARPDRRLSRSKWHSPELHGNFVGWRQLRKEIEA